MREADDLDRDANKKGKPAVRRLLLSNEVFA